MSITTKIRRQGGAAVVTIPPALLKLINAEIGSQLSLDVSDGTLIARPVAGPRKRYPLSELLKGADEMRRLNAELAEAQDGDPIGHEIG